MLGLLGQSTVQEGLGTELDQASSNINLGLAMEWMGREGLQAECVCNKPQPVSLQEHAEGLAGWTLLPWGWHAPTLLLGSGLGEK